MELRGISLISDKISQLKIIFMGNPAIAVPSLKKLAYSKHEVVAVVSNPPKRMGRGQTMSETAVGSTARDSGIRLIHAVGLKDPVLIKELKKLAPDLLVVIAYRILPEVVLGIPKKGAINLHTSLLPKYRGAAPIQRALMNGDTSTGLTTFLIEKKVDRGGILLQKHINISPEDNYGSLSERMAELSSILIMETIERIGEGVLKPRSQDNELATHAPKIKKEECIIDWSCPAEKLHNLVRGLSPLPAAYTLYDGKRIKIFKTEIKIGIGGSPGTVAMQDNDQLVINTGKDCLKLLDLQIEGKKRMSVSEFLRGTPIKRGDRFG